MQELQDLDRRRGELIEMNNVLVDKAIRLDLVPVLYRTDTYIQLQNFAL